jgi:hypothetical protein
MRHQYRAPHEWCASRLTYRRRRQRHSERVLRRVGLPRREAWRTADRAGCSDSGDHHGADASVTTSWIVSRAGIFEKDSMVCPFDGHSPSNSTGGACPRSVPSRPAQHVRVVSLLTSQKSPNRSTRCERVVSASPMSPTLWDRLAGLCVDLAVDHARRRRRLFWAYASNRHDDHARQPHGFHRWHHRRDTTDARSVNAYGCLTRLFTKP